MQPRHSICAPRLPGAALELLVRSRVTGLPVVDEDDVVVGVVSDYDLLALDEVSRLSSVLKENSMFPAVGEDWTVRPNQTKTKKKAGARNPGPDTIRKPENLQIHITTKSNTPKHSESKQANNNNK